MSIDRRQLMTGGMTVAAMGAGMGVAGMGGAGVGAAQAGLPALTSVAQAAPGSVAGVGAVLEATAFGVRPDVEADQSQALQRSLDAAAQAGRALYLPPGRYLAAGLVLRSGCRVVGEPGRSVLQLTSAGKRLLVAHDAADVSLWGLVLDGADKPLPADRDAALLSARQVRGIHIEHCLLRRSSASGVFLVGCSGRISAVEVTACAQTGLFCEDGDAFEIVHNHVHHIGNNGIEVWQSQMRRDAALVAHNLIYDIASRDGGSGQNGNGIVIFRADDVIVSHNRIAKCAFSAVRANSSSNCQILGNSCHALGEVAIYAEFRSIGAVINANLIDGAESGISVTNFDKGGRLAVVMGNLVRNIHGKRSEGIGVEADTAVVGNVVEEAADLGIGIGWGKAMRQVNANGNLIRNAKIGIGISAHQKGGYVLVVNNFISGAKAGGIRAMDHAKPQGPDLTQGSAEAFRNFALAGNVSV